MRQLLFEIKHQHIARQDTFEPVAYSRNYLYAHFDFLTEEWEDGISTATDYEPYNGTTYPISWASEAGTVYGGTLDVVSGTLTVTTLLRPAMERWRTRQIRRS